MHLNGWIGLGIGPRETRFHLAGGRTKAIAVNPKAVSFAVLALARAIGVKNNICCIYRVCLVC